VIDANRNVLVIGTTGTEANFLPEAEIPKKPPAPTMEELRRQSLKRPSDGNSEDANKKPKKD